MTTITSTDAYVTFTYNEDGLLKFWTVIWLSESFILTLDYSDRYKTFKHTQEPRSVSGGCVRGGTGYGVQRDEKDGTADEPLEVGNRLQAGEDLYIGLCIPNEWYTVEADGWITQTSAHSYDSACDEVPDDYCD